MAPPNAPNGLQGSYTRPRPIVPAIPLPYIQKRKQQTQSVNGEGSSALGGASVCDSTAASTSPQTTSGANGLADGQTDSVRDTPKQAPLPPVAVPGAVPGAAPGVAENHHPQFYGPPISTPSSSRSRSSPHPALGMQGLQSFPPNMPIPMVNGANGHLDDRKFHHPLPSHTRNGSSVHTILPPPAPAMDSLDGLLDYIQNQFAQPSLADHDLEIRYADKRSPPLRIPGHKLLFARSPVLKHLMLAQADQQGYGSARRTIVIESSDRFLRNDGAFIALQRLYGGPLLNPTLLPDSPLIAGVQGGSEVDKLDFALGYAAAGLILQVPPVLNRGIEVACRFVNWLTLERALDFALDGGLSSQWSVGSFFDGVCPSTYGPLADMLIHTALNFLVTNFPPHLDFDSSVAEPKYNGRLPGLIEDKAAEQKKHNPRLSSIRFGDHPTEESIKTTHSDTSLSAIISRVLVNLPFQLLKYVLESPTLGNVGDWATVSLRQSVMHDVVNERERRRLRVREEGKVPNSVRRTDQKEWQAVGWQEAVYSDPSRNIPTLTRTWVDVPLPE